MASVNPMQMILMLKNNSPQTVAEQIIKQNFANDPNMLKLLEMGKSGNVNGLQEVAQQFLNQQGKDFNQEINLLMNMVKNL